MTFSQVRQAPVSSGYPYHLLRNALQAFGVGPGRLDERQLRKAHRNTERSFLLESRALETPEAARVALPESRVSAAAEQVAARYESRGAFLQDLSANGLDEGSLREGLARELRFDTLMDLIGARVTAPREEEVEAFFENHSDRFRRPERRTVRHLLITVNPDHAENTPERAAARARALADDLRAVPARFGAVARAESECPSALDEGLLGTVAEGTLYPEIDDRLFKIAEGEVAGPLATEVGFHVILCEKIHPARTASLDEAAPDIRAHLLTLRQRAAQKDWLRKIGALSPKGARS